MKKRFTEEKIIQILKEADSEMGIVDLCRRHNISKATRLRRGLLLSITEVL